MNIHLVTIIQIIINITMSIIISCIAAIGHDCHHLFAKNISVIIFMMIGLVYLRQSER